MSLSNRIADLFASLRPGRPDESTSVTPVGRKQVRKRLIEALEPVLVPAGFERFDGGVARRHRDSWVDVVEIMFLPTNRTTAQSPSVDLGRYFTFCPPPLGLTDIKQDNGRVMPDVTECHVRKMVCRHNPQKGNPIPNIWYIDRASQLQACVDEVVQLTHEVMLPWFAWLDDLEVLLGLIRERKQDVEGKSRDPLFRGTWGHTNPFGQQVLAGLLAARLAKWALCVELLEPVVTSGGVRLKSDKTGALHAGRLDPAALALVRAAYERAQSQR